MLPSYRDKKRKQPAYAMIEVCNKTKRTGLTMTKCFDQSDNLSAHLPVGSVSFGVARAGALHKTEPFQVHIAARWAAQRRVQCLLFFLVSG